MTTGERIRKARKEAGLTQKQLGEKIGVSGAMIGQYETGVRNPKQETLERLSGTLGVPVENLRGWTFTFTSGGYPPRNSVHEVMSDILEYVSNLVIEEDIIPAINNFAQRLDVAKQRALLKKAIELNLDSETLRDESHKRPSHAKVTSVELKGAASDEEKEQVRSELETFINSQFRTEDET